MKKMVDISYTKEEAKKMTPEAMEMEAPKYPWGSQICLGKEMLEKLKIKNLPPIDQEYTLTAKVVVTGISERANQNETYKDVNLQITEMVLERYSEDPQARQTKATAKKVYKED